MKQRKSRLHHDTLALVLKQYFPVHATRLTVLCAVVLAMIRARSVVLYTLITHLELPGSAKVRYKRLCLGQCGTPWGLPASGLFDSPFQTPALLLWC